MENTTTPIRIVARSAFTRRAPRAQGCTIMAIRHLFIPVPAIDGPPFKNYDSRTSLVIESSVVRADGVGIAALRVFNSSNLSDTKAKAELQYVREQKAKRKAR
jgi:hypothetical protein